MRPTLSDASSSFISMPVLGGSDGGFLLTSWSCALACEPQTRPKSALEIAQTGQDGRRKLVNPLAVRNGADGCRQMAQVMVPVPTDYPHTNTNLSLPAPVLARDSSHYTDIDLPSLRREASRRRQAPRQSSSSLGLLHDCAQTNHITQRQNLLPRLRSLSSPL